MTSEGQKPFWDRLDAALDFLQPCDDHWKPGALHRALDFIRSCPACKRRVMMLVAEMVATQLGIHQGVKSLDN